MISLILTLADLVALLADIDERFEGLLLGLLRLVEQGRLLGVLLLFLI